MDPITVESVALLVAFALLSLGRSSLFIYLAQPWMDPITVESVALLVAFALFSLGRSPLFIYGIYCVNNYFFKT
jgi:hypothetical protein